MKWGLNAEVGDSGAKSSLIFTLIFILMVKPHKNLLFLVHMEGSIQNVRHSLSQEPTKLDDVSEGGQSESGTTSVTAHHFYVQSLCTDYR